MDSSTMARHFNAILSTITTVEVEEAAFVVIHAYLETLSEAESDAFKDLCLPYAPNIPA